VTEQIEVWKPVVGWEGFYSVSELGRVRSERRKVVRTDGKRYTVSERIIQPTVDRKGYERIYLRRPGESRNASVHRLVAEAFIGPLPPGMQTRHGPGGKRDNRVVNLCYGTPLENAADLERDGTKWQGGKHHNAKLTDKDVLEIRDARGRASTRDLARKYGVNKAGISRIQCREPWAHVPEATSAANSSSRWLRQEVQRND
jgi:hypothetical protein